MNRSHHLATSRPCEQGGQERDELIKIKERQRQIIQEQERRRQKNKRQGSNQYGSVN
jgi:hypothetical protein